MSTGKKIKTVSIKVVRTAAEETITEHKAVLNVSNSAGARLFSQDGKTIKDRILSPNSTWATDKTMVLDGLTYYRVSTNEWVKNSDVYEFVAVNKNITTSGKTAKTLYSTNGKAIKDRALSPNSVWFSDRVMTIDGKQMYRVATNEWVLASDLV